MTIEEIISAIITVLLTAVLAASTSVIVPWIKSQIGESGYALLSEWVKAAVTAAEQIFAGSGRGTEKKAYVYDKLSEMGVDTESDKTEMLIESAVYSLKNTVTEEETL